MGLPLKKAVILGDSESLFVQSLALNWHSRGMEVVVVTRRTECPPFCPDIRVVAANKFRTWWMRPLRVFNPVLRWLERYWPKWTLVRYQRVTGKSAPEPWEHFWVDGFWDAMCCSRAVESEQPDFVFGQEAAAYGFATARCRNVPRVLFPWGADIFFCVETSPFLRWMVRYAVRHCELIVPSSSTAVSRLVKDLGADAASVTPVSWGADLSLFERADSESRNTLLTELGFSDDAVVVMNCRRFLPLWGAKEVLGAFVDAAQRMPETRFILLGGAGSEMHVEQARAVVKAKDLTDRFYFVDGNISLERCAELMSVSDVSVSLLGTGDMRSSSVLQAAAAGGVPVLAESMEYRHMADAGFQAIFVKRGDHKEITDVIENLAQNQELRNRIRQQNRRYLLDNEDAPRQMQRLLDLIAAVCSGK